MFWYSAARRVWHSALVRPLKRRARIRALAELVMRAGMVRERLAFVAREVGRWRGLAHYTLVGTGTPFCLRHGTGDLFAFDQLICHEEYQLPLVVDQALRSTSRGLRIADLGGHIGLFGVWACARLDVAKIISFEPDPSTAPVLELQASLARHVSWETVRGCAWVKDGALAFAPAQMESHVQADLTSERTIPVPARDVFPRLVNIDLLKLDIEGSEWALFADSRFATLDARVVVAEYHRRHCPDPVDPARLARTALEGAGFDIVTVTSDRHSGLIWAMRPYGSE